MAGTAAIRYSIWHSFEVAGLGDERTRELNDEINKLLREKRHWERRIKALGGRNYLRSADVPTPGPNGPAEHKGYFYFGAARDLPGVEALLAGDRAAHRADDGEGEWDDTPIEDLLRRVDPSQYYGYQDDDLAEAERLREEADRNELIQDWEQEGKPSVEMGVEWNAAEWEDCVGRAPPQGEALQKALAKIELEEQKLSALETVDRMETS